MDAATVSLYPTMSGYAVGVISIGSTCGSALKPYSVVFHLTEPIDARTVPGELDHGVE